MSFTPAEINLGSVGGTAPTPTASGVYGRNVAISGNGLVMVASATGVGTGGTVYTFDWSTTSNAWVRRTTNLTAFDAVAGDGFGQGLALNDDGTMLVVGAPLGENAGTNRGTVYTYYCATWAVGSTWTPVTAYNATPMVAPDTTDNDYFGQHVSLNRGGSILAVGAYSWEGSAQDQGGVYIYVRSGSGASTTWAMQNGATTPQIIAADAAVADHFSHVSLSGDGTRIVVGADGWEGTNAAQGGVYTYDYSTTTLTWSQRGSVLTLPDNQGSAYFGYSLALSYDATRLIVSAATYDHTYAGEGALYTYHLSGSTWVLDDTIYAATPQVSSSFGSGLGVAGDGGFLVVGSEAYDETYADQGRVAFVQLVEGAMPGAYSTGLETPVVTAAGTGGMFRTMEGAAVLPAVTATGEGSPTLFGETDVSLPIVTASGIALLGNTGTTGASELPKVTAAGAGGQSGGEVTLPTVTLAATLRIGLMATAAMQLPRVTASGASTVTALASGSIVLPKVVSTAAALLGGLGRGDATLKKVRTAGTGSFGTRGLCALVLPAVTMDSDGFQSVIATGATSMRKIQVKGLVL